MLALMQVFFCYVGFSSNAQAPSQYGAVGEVAGYDSMTLRATEGLETLLKHALRVPRGCGA